MDADRLERAARAAATLAYDMGNEDGRNPAKGLGATLDAAVVRTMHIDRAVAAALAAPEPAPAQAGEAVAWCVRDRHGQRGNVHIEEARARAECDYLNRDSSTPYYIGQGPYEVIPLYAAPSRPGGAA